jgi:hypothetical protein
MSKAQHLPLYLGDLMLVIDPGLTTGVCRGVYTGGRTFDVLSCGEVGWDDRFVLRELVGERPHHIIVESFHLYAHKAQDQINNTFPSVHIIGMVDALAWIMGIVNRIVYQPASVRTGIQVLPEHESDVKGSAHMHDSYQHLRYYVLTNKDKRQEERHSEP